MTEGGCAGFGEDGGFVNLRRSNTLMENNGKNL